MATISNAAPMNNGTTMDPIMNKKNGNRAEASGHSHQERVTESIMKYTTSEHIQQGNIEHQKNNRSKKKENSASGVTHVSATPHAASMTSEDVTHGQTIHNSSDNGTDYLQRCPSMVDCYKLGGECISCHFNTSCVYGHNITVNCFPKHLIKCKGPTNFTRTMVCRYCYQTAHWQQQCVVSTSCRRKSYKANCTVSDDVLCLGRRKFYKVLQCNWTSGYKWSTALALSITLGGFGADRFYLGLWREGIGKLFSFGGLGVWTLLDVVLIATGYVGPADGSLFI